MTIPGLIFFCLALWAIFSKGPFFVYLPWICLPFGAMAVVDPGITMGSTVLPTSVAFVIFVGKVAASPQSRTVMWRCATNWRILAPFTVFAGYAVIAAYVCPRLFAGEIWLIPLRQKYMDMLVPLAPTPANFTQAAYTVLALLIALATIGYLRAGNRTERQQHFLNAMFAGGIVLSITGLIDWLGGKDLLTIFRNGSYGIAGYTSLGNIGRITGAFSEASTFGAVTVGLFSLLFFARTADVNVPAKRARYRPVVVGLLFCLAAACTSSTAYAGLAAAMVAMSLNAAWFVLSGRLQRNLSGLALASGVAVAVCATVLLWPAVFTAPLVLLDEAVFNKAHSVSYIQRHYWTTVGYQVFWDSHWLGAGPGAARVSSWPAAIASNVGIIGLVSMAAQLLLAFLRRPANSDRSAARLSIAGKAAIAALLAMSYVSGTNLDPGVLFSVSIGLIFAARPQTARQHSRNRILRLARAPRARHLPSGAETPMLSGMLPPFG